MGVLTRESYCSVLSIFAILQIRTTKGFEAIEALSFTVLIMLMARLFAADSQLSMKA
jgi:hypothetical protein